MTLAISQLYVYPVKSCRGILLDKVKLGKYGFLFDRLWVLVNKDNIFITARTHPKLVTIVQSITEDPLNSNKVLIKLEAEGNHEPLFLNPTPLSFGPEIEAAIWKDQVAGHDCGEEAAAWFSKAVGESVRLLIKGARARKVRDLYLERDGLGLINSETGFADGFPLLIASEESLEQLKKELPDDVKDSVDMRNFRPNLVIRGCSKPYEEDEYGVIRIGAVEFHCDKPCSRCSFPNVNPETGIPHKLEPSKTLMKSRRAFPHIQKYSAFFGINAIPLSSGGTLEVGQAVEVISRTEK